MRVRRWFELIFLLAGVAGVGVWLGSAITNAVWQNWENWVFDREVRGEPARLTDYLADKEQQVEGLFKTSRESKPVPANVAPPSSTRPIPDNELLGRLSIPRLQMSATVREGVGEETLSRALGHIPGTALPGHSGNVGVAGHRDKLFRGLRAIKKNDVIQFETVRGTFTYQVESTQIVTPQDVSVLKAAQYPQLTLVTCYPFYYVGSAPERFIVKARQVSEGPAVEPVAEKTAFVQETHAVKEVHASAAVRTIRFSVNMNHSRELAPGISLGLTNTDVPEHRVNGWMWLLADRRTIWLRDHDSNEPVVFYGSQDGKRRELRITSVTPSSVEGYLAVTD
jgi:sortase A